MKKLFFRWKDENCNGINPEWVEMTGKEFLDFKRNPKNKHRKFAEYIDEYQESATIVMEVTQDTYNRWHCEDVIRRRKRTERYVAGYKEISMDEEICGQNIEDFTLHDVIDNLEMALRKELGCLTTIHMDPVVTTDEHVTELKKQCNQIVKAIGDKLSLHDFRVVFGDSHINMIFDVVIPFEFYLSDAETTKLIQDKVWEQIGENYFVVITIDKPSVRV